MAQSLPPSFPPLTPVTASQLSVLVLSILPVTFGENVRTGWKKSFTVAAQNYSEVPVQALVDKLEKGSAIHVQPVIETAGVVLESPPPGAPTQYPLPLGFQELECLVPCITRVP